MITSRLKSGASLPEFTRSATPSIGTSAPRLSWARWPAFIIVALIGLAVRLPQLGARPMHTDEAINGYIVGQLLQGEPFTYDPQDRHGPALAALALPLARMQGAKSFSDLTESELRTTTVVAGTITILFFGAAAEMFGVVPCLLAALLFAVAPLPVYYDRYFIHESLFCAATFALILSSWRAFRQSSIGLRRSCRRMRRVDGCLQGNRDPSPVRANRRSTGVQGAEPARQEASPNRCASARCWPASPRFWH